jgi:small GTP-binding protein
MTSAPSFKSGFVSIIGAPNVGKSTLLNQLIGEKLAIISPKPQTTRNRILAVKTNPGFQMIFLDTPGIHQSWTPLEFTRPGVISTLPWYAPPWQHWQQLI